MKITGYWLWRVIVNWTIIAIAFLAVYWSLWFIPIAMFVIGTRQHALTILGHDGTHWHIHKNKRLNDLLANSLTMWPINSDIKSYRKFHFDHHRLLGTPEDPETFMHQQCQDPHRIRRFFIDIFGGGIPSVLGALKTTKPSIAVSITNLFLHVILILCGLWLVSVIWWVTLFTVYWAIFRLRVYSEHIWANGGTHKWTNPPLWKRLLFMQELTWLHYEHHEAPGIPLRILKKSK